jgi:hypothetical protein
MDPTAPAHDDDDDDFYDYPYPYQGHAVSRE